MKYTLMAIAITTLAASGSTLVITAQNTFAGASNPLLDESCSTSLLANDAVQFGYFEVSDAPAATGDPFTDFVNIGTVNISLAADGTFAETINLTDTDLMSPSGSQLVQFGIRFFNDTTVAGSTFYNTVTDPSWQFAFSNAVPLPTPSEINLDPVLGAASIPSAIWEDGAASAFCTTIRTTVIPEPSSSLTLLLGSALLFGSRRRK